MVSLPIQVTVYAGLITLAYLSLCLRKCDVQIPANLLQLGHAGAPVNHPVAVRANAHSGSPDSPVIRLVVGHVPGRHLWGTASDAVNFAGLARPLVLCPARLEEGSKVAAKNQHRALSVAGWQSSLDPGTHGILMLAETAWQSLPPYSCDGFSTRLGVGVTFSRRVAPGSHLVLLRRGAQACFNPAIKISDGDRAPVFYPP